MPRLTVLRTLSLAVVPMAAALLAGCTGSTGSGGSGLVVTSSAFGDGDTIPEEFTCTGAGDFPGIAWTGDLGDAAALAVVVDDPDAPGGTYYHLVVLDLPVATTSLAADLPSDATIALNSNPSPGWTPPCPPSGEHRYRFTVYGLSAPTGLGADATPADAIAAIDERKVAEGTLTGLVAS